jgi:hypothetical protein
MARLSRANCAERFFELSPAATNPTHEIARSLCVFASLRETKNGTHASALDEPLPTRNTCAQQNREQGPPSDE